VSENQDKRSFIWYKNLGRTFFRFVTNHAFDRRRNRRTDAQTDSLLMDRLHLHSMHRGKNETKRILLLMNDFTNYIINKLGILQKDLITILLLLLCFYRAACNADAVL